MEYRIGELVQKDEESWKPNDFDLWGRGVGVGTVVLSPFCLNGEAVDVVWPAGRCFEDLDQITKVDLDLLDTNYKPLHWSILYRAFFDYLSELRDGKATGESWSWFMSRHYAQEYVESSRVLIVKSVLGNSDIDNAELKLEESSVLEIDRILLKLAKYKKTL